MSNTNLFIDGVLIQVHVAYWSGAKALNAEDLGLDNEKIAKTFNLGKKFLIPREVIKNFRRIEGQARKLVEDNSFEFPLGSANFVTQRSFERINQRLTELKHIYMDVMVEDLISKYEEHRQAVRPDYIEAARQAFVNAKPSMTGGLDQDLETSLDADREAFIETFLARIDAHYPPADSLRKKFDLSWDIFEISAPRLTESDAATVIQNGTERAATLANARSQISQKVGGFIEDVVKVLRSETTEVCSKIVSSIKDGKVIKSNTIEALKNFIERFKDMNFVGDQTIEAQLEAVRKELLDAYPSETFKDNMETRAELGRRLTIIVEETEKLTSADISKVTGEYHRKINWE